MDTRARYQPKQRRTPSFSSSLLDAIYRSIDDPNCKDELSGIETDESVLQCRYRRRQHENTFLHDDERIRRAIMIEKWMENENRTNIDKTYKIRACYSASSSSDSSCGGVFSSSSETESKSPLPFAPILTRSSDLQQTPKHEGRLTRTKSRALKLYSDLKKAKQPISPGRRITDFLNSLFNSKKMEDLNSARRTQPVKNSTTTCSLSSSFGRPSCLSKPHSPSFRGKNRNGDRSPKRSVRFYPVTVIVDEENRPCGHKYIYGTDPSLTANPFIRKTTGNRDDYIMHYREKTAEAYRGRRSCIEEENEDDSESCTSSDLFELENIGVRGGACREELPVYATTSLKTANTAIVASLSI